MIEMGAGEDSVSRAPARASHVRPNEGAMQEADHQRGMLGVEQPPSQAG